MMKKTLTLTASAIAAALSASAYAAPSEELARVVSSTPVLEQISVPREICTDQAVVSQPRRVGSAAEIKSVRSCHFVTHYESRPVAWNVVYEYAGKHYSMQTATDPGAYVRLQITPLG